MSHYKVKRHIRLAIHEVQVSESIHLKEHSRWGIESNMNEATRELQETLEKKTNENIELSYFKNEMKLYIKRHHPDLMEIVNKIENRITVR